MVAKIGVNQIQRMCAWWWEITDALMSKAPTEWFNTKQFVARREKKQREGLVRFPDQGYDDCWSGTPKAPFDRSPATLYLWHWNIDLQKKGGGDSFIEIMIKRFFVLPSCFAKDRIPGRDVQNTLHLWRKSHNVWRRISLCVKKL